MQGISEVLRLIAVLEKVEGRKKLQKIVHILKSQGYEFPQHFGYLHYGPFSAEVAADVDTLVTHNLVDEQGGAGPRGAYIYTPTDKGLQFLKDIGLGPRNWSSLATKLNKINVSQLEAMSTILFLRNNGFSGESLKQRFSELKPKLKNEYPNASLAIRKLERGSGPHRPAANPASAQPTYLLRRVNVKPSRKHH